jgi:hypothetical protein
MRRAAGGGKGLWADDEEGGHVRTASTGSGSLSPHVSHQRHHYYKRCDEGGSANALLERHRLAPIGTMVTTIVERVCADRAVRHGSGQHNGNYVVRRVLSIE